MHRYAVILLTYPVMLTEAVPLNAASAIVVERQPRAGGSAEFRRC